MAEPSTRPGRERRRHWPHPAAVVTLTLTWALLWDRPTLLVLLSGAVLAVAVGLVFPLPPIALHGRFRPLRLLGLGLRQLADVLRSSLSVLRLVFRFGSTPRSAIVAVPLRSRNDLYLTQVAELVSLVPGSIVLEARRSTATLYLHVLDTVASDQLDRAVADVLEAERRVVRTFGSAAEITAIEDGTPWPEPAPIGEAT